MSLMFNKHGGLALSLAAGVAVGVPCAMSSAQVYEMIASGPALSLVNSSSTFDGVSETFDQLPPLLEIGALAGGSFRAVYRFEQVQPEAGSFAFYPLGALSGMTFELLDAGGVVVYSSTQSSFPEALISNNDGGAPFMVDQVFLAAQPVNVPGIMVPPAIYSPEPTMQSFASLSFFGYVDGGTNFISDLSIPTESAVYAAFPNMIFEFLTEYLDVGVLNDVEIYQIATTHLQYTVTSVIVSEVPAPGALTLLGIGGGLVVARRRRFVRVES